MATKEQRVSLSKVMACPQMQISSCVVHESGALLIEPGGAFGYDAMLRRVAPRTSPSVGCCPKSSSGSLWMMPRL